MNNTGIDLQKKFLVLYWFLSYSMIYMYFSTICLVDKKELATGHDSENEPKENSLKDQPV